MGKSFPWKLTEELWETFRTPGRCCELSCQICSFDELMPLLFICVDLCFQPGENITQKFVWVLNVPAAGGNHVRVTLCYISYTSFPTCFRKSHWDWAIRYTKDVCLLCNQSPTDLTLPFLDHFSCLQSACEFSAAEDNMTSSQLPVNNKFPFWLMMKDGREMSNFLFLT